MFFSRPVGASRSFTRKVILWFTGATLVLVAGAVAIFLSVNSVGRQNASLTQTLDTREQLGRLIGDLHQATALSRDYVITGAFDRLAPMLTASARIREDLRLLDGLLGVSPEQSVRLRQIKPMIERQLHRFDQILEVYRDRGREAAFAAMADTAASGDRMRIQSLIDAMLAAERRIVDEHQRRATATGQWALVVGSVCIGLCFGIFSFVFWLIRREGVRRTETEAYLQQAIEEKERVSRTTSRINKIADFLQSCRTPAEAFQLISQQMPALLPGTGGGVGVNSGEHGHIEMVLSWGDDVGCAGEFLADECWALRRGRMHVTESAGLDPVCGHVTAQHLVSLCMPMMAHGESVGMLYVTSNEHAEFSEEMLALVRAVSEQTALALANLRLQETLQTQSIRDPLTQLFNRRYMEASLDRELSRAKRNDQPLSVIMLDIDHFKKFNDSYGHEAGDLLLAEFGQLISRHVRAEDIACRYGGEEFVLIVPGADPGIAYQRAEALRLATKALNLQYNHMPLGQITISAGFATFPDTSADPTKLVTAADLALYKAKHGGRDRVVAADEHGPGSRGADLPLQIAFP